MMWEQKQLLQISNKQLDKSSDLKETTSIELENQFSGKNGTGNYKSPVVEVSAQIVVDNGRSIEYVDQQADFLDQEKHSNQTLSKKN